VIVDPFAASSTAGKLATLHGFKYWGLWAAKGDLDPTVILHPSQRGRYRPRWMPRSLEALDAAPMADLIFGEPPPMEELPPVGIEDPRWAYIETIRRACARLKADRFAALFVSNYYRDGALVSMAAETVRAFESCGLVLVTEGALTVHQTTLHSHIIVLHKPKETTP
jgi:hypothetical protein